MSQKPNIKKTDKSISFGKRLRKARKLRKHTQSTLAKSCGVTQSVISKIERGDQESSGYTLLLSSELRINPMWLAYGKGEINAQNTIIFNTFMTECYVYAIHQCEGCNATFRQVTIIAETLYNEGISNGIINNEIAIPLLQLIKES